MRQGATGPNLNELHRLPRLGPRQRMFLNENPRHISVNDRVDLSQTLIANLLRSDAILDKSFTKESTRKRLPTEVVNPCAWPTRMGVIRQMVPDFQRLSNLPCPDTNLALRILGVRAFIACVDQDSALQLNVLLIAETKSSG